MIILNLIWKFSTGGIGKCFLTYAKLQDVDNNIKVVSVCIDPQNCNYDRTALNTNGIIIIPIKSVLDFSWKKKTKELIDNVNPDIILCHGFNGPVVIHSVLKSYNRTIPMVCTYHGLYHAPKLWKKPIAPLFNYIQTHHYRKYANKVISVENYSLPYLKRKGVPENIIKVVHNGIPRQKDSKKLDLPYKGITIGLASRLDKVKGISYLLEAVSFMKAKTKQPFHVYIVGDGPLEKKMRIKIKNLHIEDCITMTGYQNNITNWLATWDIFCLPSLHEYHSIALLEAMRAGKAIVATNVGGNTESVNDKKEGLIIPAKNPQAMCDALVKLLESESLRKTLGENAQIRFEKEFTEEVMKRNMVIELKEVYEKCKK